MLWSPVVERPGEHGTEGDGSLRYSYGPTQGAQRPPARTRPATGRCCPLGGQSGSERVVLAGHSGPGVAIACRVAKQAPGERCAPRTVRGGGPRELPVDTRGRRTSRSRVPSVPGDVGEGATPQNQGGWLPPARAPRSAPNDPSERRPSMTTTNLPTPEKWKAITPQGAVNVLNRALACDRPAIAALVANRVPCNTTL